MSYYRPASLNPHFAAARREIPVPAAQSVHVSGLAPIDHGTIELVLQTSKIRRKPVPIVPVENPVPDQNKQEPDLAATLVEVVKLEAVPDDQELQTVVKKPLMRKIWMQGMVSA